MHHFKKLKQFVYNEKEESYDILMGTLVKWIGDVLTASASTLIEIQLLITHSIPTKVLCLIKDMKELKRFSYRNFVQPISKKHIIKFNDAVKEILNNLEEFE